VIVHLVRHPPVAKAWQKRCYGQSDPGLSREGQRSIARIVDVCVALRPDVVVHSGMRRTRAIAEPLAQKLRVSCMVDALWCERNFGTWEGETWNRIYRDTGNAMDGMLTAPDTFRPGGGETTRELIDRIARAVNALPDVASIVVVAHGGPIAAVKLCVCGLPVAQMPQLIPKCGEVTTVSLPAHRIMSGV
jgi:alpha-ribazole phosphatase